jgi:hypothetical protein
MDLLAEHRPVRWTISIASKPRDKEGAVETPHLFINVQELQDSGSQLGEANVRGESQAADYSFSVPLPSIDWLFSRVFLHVRL